MKLSKNQKARIFCVKNGHADFGYGCWGYVHCGRCDEQIGDRLGSIFTANFADVSCKENPCSYCDPIIAKLSSSDKKIYDALKKKHEEDLKEFVGEKDV